MPFESEFCHHRVAIVSYMAIVIGCINMPKKITVSVIVSIQFSLMFDKKGLLGPGYSIYGKQPFLILWFRMASQQSISSKFLLDKGV